MASNSPSEAYKGWLTKKGGIRKNWNKRWFVLYSNGELKYFEKIDSEKPIKSVDLHQVLTIQPCREKGVPEFTIQVQTADRVWYFAAESDDLMTRWRQMLEAAVGTAQRLQTTREGWLMKKGKINTSWKTRYFALGKGWLFYFKDAKDCEVFKSIAFFSENALKTAFHKYVCGSILLENAKADYFEETKNRFYVKTPKRVFHIIGNSEKEVAAWIKTLSTALGVVDPRSREVSVGAAAGDDVNDESSDSETSDSDADGPSKGGMDKIEEDDEPAPAPASVPQPVPLEAAPPAPTPEPEEPAAAPVEEPAAPAAPAAVEEEAQAAAPAAAEADAEKAAAEPAAEEPEAGAAAASPASPEDIWLRAAQAGMVFVKHGRRGKPHAKVIQVDSVEKSVSWGSKADKKVAFMKVTAIEKGKTTGPLQRKIAFEVDPDLCFSIVTPDRTLDLEATSVEVRDEWVARIGELVFSVDK